MNQHHLRAILLFLVLSAGLHLALLSYVTVPGPTCQISPFIEIRLGGGVMAAPRAVARAKAVKSARNKKAVGEKRSAEAGQESKAASCRPTHTHKPLAKEAKSKRPPRPRGQKEMQQAAAKAGVHAAPSKAHEHRLARLQETGPSSAASPLPPSRSVERRHGSELRQKGLRNYLSLVRSRIEACKRYPWNARNLGWEGEVVVSFSIDATGALRGLKIDTGSGYRILDRAAIAAVTKAAPFPPPPAVLSSPISIQVPIRFSLLSTNRLDRYFSK